MRRSIVIFTFLFVVINASLGISTFRGKPERTKLPSQTQSLKQALGAKSIAYPPKQAAFLVFKKERILEVWAKQRGEWAHIKNYPIRGASGHLGPKLRQGDYQVPEGIYKVLWLNPNSNFHLSMKLNYPNAFDLKYAKQESRRKPGGDIFIHGGSASVGCLAMGNEGIEELYELAKRTGVRNIKVIISPYDLRQRPYKFWVTPSPKWLPELYGNIKMILADFVLSS